MLPPCYHVIVRYCLALALEDLQRYAQRASQKAHLNFEMILLSSLILYARGASFQGKHPQFSLFSGWRSENWYFLVMELVGGGELFDVIVRNKSLNEMEASHLAADQSGSCSRNTKLDDVGVCCFF